MGTVVNRERFILLSAEMVFLDGYGLEISYKFQHTRLKELQIYVHQTAIGSTYIPSYRIALR